MKTRVIPVLLLKNGGLYKTQRFKNAQYVGDPINAVRILCGKEVDELALLDIDATRAGTGPDFDLLHDIVSEAFMPVAYGGGITTADQAARLFELGIEKIVLNSVLAENPALVDELASRFGSQAIVASLDVGETLFRSNQVVVRNGQKAMRCDLLELARDLERRGVGEIFLTSIKREGTGTGYDCQMVRQVADAVKIPVVAHGGAATLSHFAEAVAAGASAVAAGSMFVYHGPHRAVLISYPERRALEDVLP